MVQFTQNYESILKENEELKKENEFLSNEILGLHAIISKYNNVGKSSNELRAEVIQRAKEFIENTKTKEFTGRVITGDGLPGEGRTNTHYDVYVFGDKPKHVCDVEFIVHQEKHTVVALMRGILTKKIYSKGIAKCHPDDVFNEHIGKAIALGRALGKDVSEFENAVQPNFEVGQTARLMPRYEGRESEIQITKVDEDKLWFVNEFGVEMYMDTGVNVVEIIDDTNAQYKEVSE